MSLHAVPSTRYPQPAETIVLAIVAVEHYGSHCRHVCVPKGLQCGVGPTEADFHSAREHVDHGRRADGDRLVHALYHVRPAPSHDKPHLITEVIRVVVGLVVNDQNLAVGRTIFQNGKQGIVQLPRIA